MACRTAARRAAVAALEVDHLQQLIPTAALQQLVESCAAAAAAAGAGASPAATQHSTAPPASSTGALAGAPARQQRPRPSLLQHLVVRRPLGWGPGGLPLHTRGGGGASLSSSSTSTSSGRHPGSGGETSSDEHEAPEAPGSSSSSSSRRSNSSSSTTTSSRSDSSSTSSSSPPGKTTTPSRSTTSPTSTSSTSSTSTSSTAPSSAAPLAPQQPDPLSAALAALQAAARSPQLTPSAIVARLDKHIVGQQDAKRAVAVALRNRWRRHKLPAGVAAEITPKNILMVGPTGVGKTEIARRLAQLVDAPFLKVEATRFTELGFVGGDVEDIVKDLVEASITLTRARLSTALRDVAGRAAEGAILAALLGPTAPPQSLVDQYRLGALDGMTVELDLDALGVERSSSSGGSGSGSSSSGGGQPSNPLQALAAMMEAVQGRARGGGGGLGMSGRGGGGKSAMTVSEARRLLVEAEVERALSSERVTREALRAAAADGIVVIDEIDKIVTPSRGAGRATSSNVSSEGVQRDLLPILEGSVVTTKHGPVATDHVLFIASGAFHSSKLGDMLAELQGRLPVRVELSALTADDFYRILTEPAHSMVKQQQALLATEGVDLVFEEGALRAVAEAAAAANQLLDNIGARRLHTVVERVLADISFDAPERTAAARQQQQQHAAAVTVAAEPQEASGSSSSSSSGAGGAKAGRPSKAGQGGGKAGGAGKAAAKAASSKHKQQEASAGSSSSSGGGGGAGQPPLLVTVTVTREMVDACMKDVLQREDLSRYVL